VESEDIHTILEAGRWAPTAHNMQNFEIVVVDDPAINRAIGKTQRPVSPVFVREKYASSVSRREELLREDRVTCDHVPACLGGTPNYQPERTALRSAAPRCPGTRPWLVGTIQYRPAPAPRSLRGDFLGILSLGCVLENMWLMAASLGIGFHVMSAFAGVKTAADVCGFAWHPEKWKIAFHRPAGLLVSTARPATCECAGIWRISAIITASGTGPCVINIFRHWMCQ